VRSEPGFGSRDANQDFVVCASKPSGVFSGEAAPVTMSLLPGAEGEEAERKKETMELFPQSAGFGTQDASSDPARYCY
jgi:jasmonate ZIM domain-containing protein